MSLGFDLMRLPGGPITSCTFFIFTQSRTHFSRFHAITQIMKTHFTHYARMSVSRNHATKKGHLRNHAHFWGGGGSLIKQPDPGEFIWEVGKYHPTKTREVIVFRKTPHKFDVLIFADDKTQSRKFSYNLMLIFSPGPTLPHKNDVHAFFIRMVKISPSIEILNFFWKMSLKYS